MNAKKEIIVGGIIFSLIILFAISAPLMDFMRTHASEKLTGFDRCYANDAFFSLNLNHFVASCYKLDKWENPTEHKYCIINLLKWEIVECNK